MAIQAIEAGCHVLTEKPLSDSSDGAGELDKLAQKHKKKVMVALCFRYHDGLIKARRHLASGRFGRLVCIRALMGEHLPQVRPDYRDLFTSKYSGAFDLMHDLDLALWMADLPVKAVKCIYGNFSDIGIEAPDLVELLVEFQGPCAASVHLDFFQIPRRRQFELICTEGLIVVEFARWDTCTVSTYQAGEKTWRHEPMTTDRDDMFRAEDREFLQAVAEDQPIHSTIDEGLKSIKVIEAARKNGTDRHCPVEGAR
jgi:predicted dehydrogenase